MPTEMPDIVAIGSSTGGPQALFTVLGALKPGIPQPIVITQHMPATFTTILAEHIERASGIPTVEGADGMPVQGGHAYVAPGDFHMVIELNGPQRVIRLLKTPPENFCRPSVDPMLRSLTKIYGRKIFTVILTGMGQDGLKGGEAVIAAGGSVIAQDEATSVVWGMPGAVSMAGLCSAVVPLTEVAPLIRRVAARAAS
jgi:two-component system chemotaxis response regulator CheB